MSRRSQLIFHNEQLPIPVAVKKLDSPYAVVIPCHNYGRFLGEAIESVLAQSIPPAEIVVVDDASTDNTWNVASSYEDRGVQYFKVNERSSYLTRAAGFHSTSSPFLVFLDADDWLGKTYAADALKAFTEANIGITYSHLIDNGPGGPVRAYPAINMEGQNYIHAGAMVRRIAINQADGFGSTDNVNNERADWFLWRRVMRAGWKAQYFDGEYFYRRHESNISHNDKNYTYRHQAMLDFETVTVVLPLSGRDRFLPQLQSWMYMQQWKRIELLILDSGENPVFSAAVKHWLATLDISATYVKIPGIKGLADADRHQHEHFRAVQEIMPRIYRELSRVQTEFAMVVEEDVLPPLDAISRLMDGFHWNVAAVSGVYRSRWNDKSTLLVWDTSHKQWKKPKAGIEDVGGSGFGCLLYRRSAMSQLVLHAGGPSGNFDPNASLDLRVHGWRWLVNWDVHCVHDGIEV